MTWEDSWLVKNRCHPTRDGGADAARPSVAGPRQRLARRTIGVAAVARGGEHARGRKACRFYERRVARRRRLPIMGNDRSRPLLRRRRAAGAAPPAMPRHTVFFVSDGTGITAETFGNSILSQFAIKPRHLRRPFIDTPDKAHQVVREINHTAEHDGRKPIVFITLVNTEILSIVKEHAHGLVLDMFNTFIEPLEAEFGITSNHRIGRFSDVSESQEYTDRIEAINFALAHDDGQSAKNLAEADVILVGVSRSGKTPTSLYLAMQHGIKAANYPLIPEDFERGQAAVDADAVQGQVLRPDDRPGPARPHPQRAPAEQQVRVDRELPLRSARGRDDDEEGRHRLAVVDAQVDRGDRDDDPARPQAGSAGVLSAAWRRRARRMRLQPSSRA